MLTSFLKGILNIISERFKPEELLKFILQFSAEIRKDGLDTDRLNEFAEMIAPA